MYNPKDIGVLRFKQVTGSVEEEFFAIFHQSLTTKENVIAYLNEAFPFPPKNRDIIVVPKKEFENVFLGGDSVEKTFE